MRKGDKLIKKADKFRQDFPFFILSNDGGLGLIYG